MSKSRMYQVPENLAPCIQRLLSAYCAANPIAAMGADERRAELRRLVQALRKDPEYRSLLEVALKKPRSSIWSDLPLSPQDPTLVSALEQQNRRHQSAAATQLLATLAAWPKTATEEETYRRRTTFSAMVTQLLTEALVARGALEEKYLGLRTSDRRESF